MKFALLAFTLALSSHSALAAGLTKAQAEAEAQEKVFVGICQPKEAATKLSSDERKELEQLRTHFVPFLINPAPTVEMFKKSALFNSEADDGLIEKLSLSIHFGFTCGLTFALEPKFASRGCSLENGKKISAQTALELCRPLVEKMAAENAEGAESEEEPSSN